MNFGENLQVMRKVRGLLMAGLAVFLALISTGTWDADSGCPAMVFLLFVTVAAPMLVYAGIQKNKYNIQQYNRENSVAYQKQSELVGRISGMIMMCATIIFIILGFCFESWDCGWLVFPIGGMLCGIVAIILNKDSSK